MALPALPACYADPSACGIPPQLQNDRGEADLARKSLAAAQHPQGGTRCG
jgi:hypothetical protein